MKRRRFQGQVTAAPLLESSLATIGAITGNGFLSSKSRAPESAIQLALSRPSALARSGVSRSSAGLADPEPTLRITIDIQARRARSRGPAAEVRPVLRDRHLGTDALSRWSEGEKRRLRRGPQLHRAREPAQPATRRISHLQALGNRGLLRRSFADSVNNPR